MTLDELKAASPDRWEEVLNELLGEAQDMSAKDVMWLLLDQYGSKEEIDEYLDMLDENDEELDDEDEDE